MTYYTNADAINLVKLEIEARKKVIGIITEAIKVIKKFDGKMFNKRLETALKEIDNGITIKKDWFISSGWINIEWYISNRSVQSTQKDNLGYATTNYIKYNTLSLCRVDYDYNNTENSAIEATGTGNGKIKADIFIQALIKAQSEYAKRIKELENSLVKVNEFENRMNKIKKEFELLNEEIPYIMKQYFYELNYDFVRR